MSHPAAVAFVCHADRAAPFVPKLMAEVAADARAPWYWVTARGSVVWDGGWLFTICAATGDRVAIIWDRAFAWAVAIACCPGSTVWGKEKEKAPQAPGGEAPSGAPSNEIPSVCFPAGTGCCGSPLSGHSRIGLIRPFPDRGHPTLRATTALGPQCDMEYLSNRPSA